MNRRVFEEIESAVTRGFPKAATAHDRGVGVVELRDERGTTVGWIPKDVYDDLRREGEGS
jgi:hypothetical protein